MFYVNNWACVQEKIDLSIFPFISLTDFSGSERLLQEREADLLCSVFVFVL